MPPTSRRPPVCGHTFDERTCRKRGEHLCRPRGDHVVAFFRELLRHTKGRWARQAFVPARWQERDILRPLFGTVLWDEAAQRYVRRYRVAYLSCARKSGKSEILAGIALYLLVADGEEGAEVYGAAADRAQAAKVYDVAARMVRLSPTLSRRLTVRDHVRRIVDEQTASYYEVLAADAKGNLGHNPHAVVFDELLAQADSRLYDALRSAQGARTQPLLVVATTATDDPESWPALYHAEAQRVAEDPDRARHMFVWIREVPRNADPWDESLWPLANPALGDFLSWSALREEAVEARNEPARENQFRQYRLNQVVAQASRWMPLHLYDACIGEPWPMPEWRRAQLAGRLAYGGLDLAAKLDLTAWCLIVPDPAGGPADALWRFWAPEAAVRDLDQATGGRASVWMREGWLTVTDGDVLDFDQVYEDIAADAAHFRIREVGYDRWSGQPAIHELERRARRTTFVEVPQTYTGLTAGMTEVMALTKARDWAHHANPVARFCFDSVEVKHPPDDPDLIRPVKPKRGATGARIDAVPVAAMAVAAWRTRIRRDKTVAFGI